MKQIQVPGGVKTKLEREFESDNKTINNALNLLTDTNLANAIRERAFELGGKLVEVEQVKVNNDNKS